MLAKTADVTHDFEIVESAGPAAACVSAYSGRRSPRRRAAARAASILRGVADERRARAVGEELAAERRGGAGEVDRDAAAAGLAGEALDHVGGRGVDQRDVGEVDDEDAVGVADAVERRADRRDRAEEQRAGTR